MDIATRSAHPALARLARVLLVVQTAIVAGLAVTALGVAAAAHHDDLAAQRAGEPTDGLGVGLGIFFGTVFGALAIVLAAGCVGFFRERMWGRVTVGIVEGIVVLVAVPHVLFGGTINVVSLAAVVPAGVVLASIVTNRRRAATATGAAA